jgi:hypothetical protein
LVLRELAGGIEREFPLPGPGIPSGSTIDFCPDGRSVIVSRNDILRITLDRGDVELLMREGVRRAVCIGDGSEIVYLRGGGGADARHVVHRSLVSGAETTLHAGMADFLLHRSPDGSKIAFVVIGETEAQLLVMPSRGGQAMTVATSPTFTAGRLTEFQGVMWLPHGEGLVVARLSSGQASALVANPDIPSPEVTLWRVPLDGGPAAEVGRMRLPAYERAFVGSLNYSLNPDGSRIAFERHAGLRAQEWAIDNLLPFIQSGATATPEP